MIVIKRLCDIRFSRLSDVVIQYLEKLFRTIAKGYTGKQNTDAFFLEPFGPIVFLENKTDCRDLSSIGITGPYRCVIPEYVEKRSLTDEKGGSLELYVATIIMNDNFCLTVVSEVGSLDAETEKFLASEYT